MEIIHQPGIIFTPLRETLGELKESLANYLAGLEFLLLRLFSILNQLHNASRRQFTDPDPALFDCIVCRKLFA